MAGYRIACAAGVTSTVHRTLEAAERQIDRIQKLGACTELHRIVSADGKEAPMRTR